MQANNINAFGNQKEEQATSLSKFQNEACPQYTIYTVCVDHGAHK